MKITTRLYNSIKRGQKGRNKGLSTGFPKLDKIIYGIQRRYFTTICGDSGSGKSTLALYMYVYRPLMEAIKNNVNVNILYFSFEMSDEVLFAKLLSIYIWEEYQKEISYEEILSLVDPISEEDMIYVDKAFTWLKKIEPRIKIIDKSLPPTGVYAVAREWNKQFGEFVEINEHAEIFTPHDPDAYGIIVVDHIRLLSGNGSKKEQIDTCCDILIGFRNKCNNTICVVQQVNRGFKSMDRRNSGTYQLLQLDDMADSSSPAQSSEVVIGIYDAHREKMSNCEGYVISQMKDSFRLFQVMKNRFGLSNKNTGVAFAGSVGYWREMPKPNEIRDYSIYANLLAETDENVKIPTGEEKDQTKFEFTF